MVLLVVPIVCPGDDIEGIFGDLDDEDLMALDIDAIVAQSNTSNPAEFRRALQAAAAAAMHAHGLGCAKATRHTLLRETAALPLAVPAAALARARGGLL